MNERNNNEHRIWDQIFNTYLLIHRFDVLSLSLNRPRNKKKKINCFISQYGRIQSKLAMTVEK